MKRIRCAIYTRKSPHEGLDQSFNSLDAQREACEAYIQPQKHEGWKVLSDRFDDGGVSDGTIDRPACLDLECVRKLKAWADDKGLRTKRRCFHLGQQSGGVSFSRGSLYHLLSNPIYIGKIRHRDELHDGQHEPILDQHIWDSVQQQLSSNRVDRTTRRNASHRSLLAGRIFGSDGKALTPTHSNKGKKRYRYYVSKDGSLRLPAKELETAIKTAISNHRPLSLYCEQNALSDEAALKLIDRVRLADGELKISFDPKTDIPAFTIPYLKRKRGIEHKLVLDGSARRDPDLALIKRTVRAMDWAAALRAGRSISEIAQTESVSPEYVTHNLGLAFLSPKILKAIMSGQQRPDVSVYRLSKVHIPAAWDQQDSFFFD